MVKLAGAIMAGFACGYFGFRMRLNLKARLKSLNDILVSFEALESEISFSVNRLKKAFERSDTNGLFLSAAEKLEHGGAKRAWKEAVAENSRRLCLTDADCDALLLLGGSIGKTDSADQVKNIRYVKELVASQAKQAEEDYTKRGKLFSSGGALIGALVVIILI